jgi:hypothetical protein
LLHSSGQLLLAPLVLRITSRLQLLLRFKATTANEYMQELPESVQQMVGTVYAMLTSTATEQQAG